jgi:hypothetical protein
MGAGIAASPHCAERRICRCSRQVRPKPPRPRSWLTSSGVASRSIALSEEKPSGLLARAARGPACLSIVRPVRRPGIRSFAALLGMTAPASRYAYPQSEDWFEPRRAGGKIISSGASSRLASGLLPKKRPNCLSGGDRTFRPFLPREAGTSVPITKQLCASPRVAPSEIVGCKPVDNGDMAHNLRNHFHGARRLLFRSCRLTCGECPNPRFPLLSPAISQA